MIPAADLAFEQVSFSPPPIEICINSGQTSGKSPFNANNEPPALSASWVIFPTDTAATPPPSIEEQITGIFFDAAEQQTASTSPKTVNLNTIKAELESRQEELGLAPSQIVPLVFLFLDASGSHSGSTLANVKERFTAGLPKILKEAKPRLKLERISNWPNGVQPPPCARFQMG